MQHYFVRRKKARLIELTAMAKTRKIRVLSAPGQLLSESVFGV
jgi:hypothetical protein